MNKFYRILAYFSLLILCSCSLLTNQTFDQWTSFTEQIEQLDGLGLAAKYNELLAEYELQQNDQNRLYLGYLLSRPNQSIQDLVRSKTILYEIEHNGFYAVLRDSLISEIELMSQPPSNADRWISFVAEVETLEDSELSQKLRETRYNAEKNQLQTDEVAIYQAYLLSRPNTAIQDLPASRALLQQISPGSPYATIKNGLIEQLNLRSDLILTQRKLEGTQAQLETLKAIDDDLTESQRQIEQTAPTTEAIQIPENTP